MRTRFALAADSLLAAICAFLLIFTLVRYYYKNIVIAVISGIVGGAAFGFIIFCYIRSKQRKSVLFGKEAEEKSRLAVHLCLLPAAEAYSLIMAVTGGIKKGKFIVCDNAVYYPIIKAEPCDTDDILPAMRANYGDKNKVIICNYITDKAKLFAAECGVAVWDCAELYKKLKKADALPSDYLYTKPAKVKLLKAIKMRFTRKLCLPAFWSGAALIFMSWFTYYPVYYIVSGSVLLAVCVGAAVFGQPKSI